MTRSTSEHKSLNELLLELGTMEDKMCALLDALTVHEIADIAPWIATLMDAGSADFFSGVRHEQGRMVKEAARRALTGREGGGLDEVEDDDVESIDDDGTVASLGGTTGAGLMSQFEAALGDENAAPATGSEPKPPTEGIAPVDAALAPVP